MELREAYAAMLRELAELGMRLARLAGERALREADDDLVTPLPARAGHIPGEAARTFVKLSNAVRMVIAMGMRLAAGEAIAEPASVACPASQPASNGRRSGGYGGRGDDERDGRGDRLSAAEADFFAAVRAARTAVEGPAQAAGPETNVADPGAEPVPAAPPDWREDAWERVRKAAFRRGAPLPADNRSDAVLFQLMEGFSVTVAGVGGPPGTGPPCR